MRLKFFSLSWLTLSCLVVVLVAGLAVSGCGRKSAPEKHPDFKDYTYPAQEG